MIRLGQKTNALNQKCDEEEVEVNKVSPIT